jgi:hypothetical protein
MANLTRKLIVAHDHTFNNGESLPVTSLNSIGITEGKVPTSDGSGGVTWEIGGGGVEEGPGIDVVNGNMVGLGLDTILLAHADGRPASEYPHTDAGLRSAISAAISGEIIWKPAGTLILSADFLYRPGDTLQSGSVAGTSDSGVAITGLTLGELYCVETNGWFNQNIGVENWESTLFQLCFDGVWTPSATWGGIPTRLAWNGNAIPPQVPFVEKLGDWWIRIFFIAPTSLIVRTGDDVRNDNDGYLGFTIKEATHNGSLTIPSGVEMVGLGRNSVIAGDVICNGKLTNLTVTGTISGSGQWLIYDSDGLLVTNQSVKITTASTPLEVNSTVLVTNLNADKLDGHDWSEVLELIDVVSYPIVNPTTIPGCILWLDANQIVANDQDVIGTWTDMSGNGNNATQSTVGNRPTFCTNMKGGKPALYFDNNDFLNLGTNITSSTSTVFIVWDFFYKIGYSALLQFQKYGVYSFLTSSGQWGVYRTGELSSGSGSFGDEFKISEVLFGDTVPTMLYTNGRKKIVAGGTNMANAVSRVGWDGSAEGQYHQGMISEIIVYNNVLSEENRLIIERSLASKYFIKLI